MIISDNLKFFLLFFGLGRGTCICIVHWLFFALSTTLDGLFIFIHWLKFAESLLIIMYHIIYYLHYCPTFCHVSPSFLPLSIFYAKKFMDIRLHGIKCFSSSLIPYMVSLANFGHRLPIFQVKIRYLLLSPSGVELR